ncbi:hypothetical protein [Cellulomonas palmilytica]|uniref:hypothetical protein n=1 Tax=Cellulomonas palmilytica TaxID=2608402 RepID=UPI001F3A73ED|nr:hypothetical protein [Cellulomonas palmilytica]UJP39557.1 hypothetical protein F1D97_14750 [Cellulomonas palmilytica]
MSTLVLATDAGQVARACDAAASGVLRDDDGVLLLVASLAPVPEVAPSPLEGDGDGDGHHGTAPSTGTDLSARAADVFTRVLDLGALVAPQHPAVWDLRDLAAGAPALRDALAGVHRVVRCAPGPVPVLPLVLPDARTGVLDGREVVAEPGRLGAVPTPARAQAARGRVLRTARRAPGALRRRVERALRPWWERRVLARATRDLVALRAQGDADGTPMLARAVAATPGWRRRR